MPKNILLFADFSFVWVQNIDSSPFNTDPSLVAHLCVSSPRLPPAAAAHPVATLQVATAAGRVSERSVHDVVAVVELLVLEVGAGVDQLREARPGDLEAPGEVEETETGELGAAR